MEMNELLQKAADGVTVGRAFGPAYEKDGCLVIPVAWVAGGGGGGAGQGVQAPKGDRPSVPSSSATTQDQLNKGEGGGFGLVSWPLGVFVVKDGDVRWVPAVDVTRLLLTGAALVRLVLKARSRRRLRAGSP